MNMRKLCLSIILILGGQVALNAQSADINRASRTEIQLLDGETITVTLSGAQYVRTGALSPQAFILEDAPAALSITAVNAINTTVASVSLISTDFDVDFPYFHITIHDSVLNVVSPIETDTCALTANIERAVLTSSPLPLSEYNIDTDGSAYLDIALNGEEFTGPGGNDIHIDSITLINFPAGVEKDHIDYGAPTNTTNARLHIKYTPGDFDGDIENAGLTINAGCLLYSTDSLGTDTLLIRGFTESVSYTSGFNLDEQNLNNAYVLVDLTNDETTTTGNLSAGDVELVNFPGGTSIESASSDGTRITVNLDFDYTDFDTDDTDGQVRVKGSILKWNTTNDLLTTAGDITITAHTETPSASISPDIPLTEYNLNGRILTVSLTDEWITNTAFFDELDITLLNKPTTLGISQVIPLDSSEFEIHLSYTYEDFETDLGLRVSIEDSVLWHSTSALVSSPETITATDEVPVANMTADSIMEEYTLPARYAVVKLTQEWITDISTFDTTALALNDAPAGLHFESMSINDSSEFTIYFDFTYYDFDANKNLSVTIDHTKLFQSGSDLTSDVTTVYAKVENPIATLTPDIPLEEYSLSGRSIVVMLEEEWIIDTSSFDTLDLALVGAPVGLHFDSISVKDSIEFTIFLDHEYTDFDQDSNFTLLINHLELIQTEGPDNLESQVEVIIAKVEDPKAILTGDPFPLQEYYLKGKTLNVWLDEEWIINTGDFNIADLTLVHATEGLDMVSVTPSDSANFTILLKNTYHDFDTDSLLQLSINQNKLLQSTDTDLLSDTTLLEAYVENPAAEITPDIPLKEYGLDGRTILLEMDEEWIIDTGDFDANHIALVDAPAGLSIVSAIPIDSANVTIRLSNIIIDFDVDSLLKISIDHTKLIQSVSTGSDLVSDTTLVEAYVENPVATMTPSSWLREFFLDTMSLDIEFTEEVFNSTTLNTGHFGLYHAPAGLSVDSLANVADSSITLLLAFDGTDFDDSITDVRVSISHDVLIQTESDSLRTAAFTIKANIEPVVGSVSFANDTMMIDELVEVTINLAEYTVDSVYTLAGGNIGGYVLDSLKWVSDSEYKAWFTVSEGGNDFLAPEPIPVDSLQLDDLPVEGVPYISNVVQDKDLLDANKPVVKSLTVIGESGKQIGDDVVILISAFEEDFVPEDTTEINQVPMTRPNVVFNEIGGGTYTMTYTIEPDDNNVDPGALVSKIYLRDIAGNINDVYPGIDTNILSIDAGVPVITSLTNTTPTDTVIIGAEVTLAVQADASGYNLTNDSEVNGIRKNEGLIFSSAGTIYNIRYPVKENDPSVAAGDLEARIILEDLAGNRSITDTVILNKDDLAVLTQRPTALLTGNDEICLNDTATLYITLGGAPPWKLKYRNTVDSFYIENILTSSYTLRLTPAQTMNYSIDSVWDGTGNENIGIGNSVVIVNPLPVVDILNLEAIYAVTDTNGVQLQGDPFGGSFYGPGVITQQNFFSPPGAGLTHGTPHWIYYEYRDAKSCFNVDSQSVQIVQADVKFYWPNEPYNTACYLDQAYTLTAENIDSTTGHFTIEDKLYPTGFMVDNGDNTVTFNPSILDWIPGQDYVEEFTVRYDYPDKDSVPLFEKNKLVIEFFDTAYIETDLSEKQSCSNDVIFPLTGSRTQGIFSGPGIVDLGGFVYEFNPRLADTGINWIIYSFESANKCVQKDSAMILINKAPDPEFEFIDSCILSDGGQISFSNISDTGGLGGDIEWVWDYGDLQSGQANRDVFSTMQNGSHVYPGPGRRTVTLTATVQETGCLNFESITKDLGNTPDVNIGWNTECFSDSPIQFTGDSDTEDGDSTFRWRITDFSGTDVKVEEGPALKVLSHIFSVRDNYSVEFTAITDIGCFASITDTIYLRPYFQNITDDVPYTEDFEGDAPGWFAFAHESSPQKSWKLAMVEAEEFPYDMVDKGTSAWYTDLVKKDTVEQSWVSSPCFDFSNMRRPMISLDRKVSSDRDRDGAVLQYTHDDGKNWHNVGAVDDGSINWYNTFRIQNGPGEQGEGWTGGFVFEKFEDWKQSRHNLDDLTGRSRVQFRIAYGSSGSSVVENEGFAFDNVWIGERSRVVLIEHFTNSGMSGSNDANQRINQLVKNNYLDVIDVQYHAKVIGFEDKINQDNPAPASARSLFYGTRQVPYMLMDGGISGLMAYDFSDNDLDTLDLFTRALVDPSFEIDLNVTEQDNKLDITIDLKALEALPDKEYIVYTVVVEKLIDDPMYAGAGSVSVFENAVRDMVPSAAGVSLIRSWNPGDTENMPLSWDISEKILNKEMLFVIVFIQDAENHNVYQAASNDPELNGDPVGPVSVRDYMQAKDLAMLVYPNPATREAYLVFAETLSEPLGIQLFSHTGSLVRNDLLPAGTEMYTMDVSGLENGVYFIRAIQQGRVIGTRKLMIIH